MHVRAMTHADLGRVLGWAADEGWNPGLDDAAAFLEADPEGFFVAEVEGRAVAAISVVNHSDSFSFLGLYICLPDFRGQGIGYALWQQALGHAGNRTVGLDGVPAQQDNYRKSGFDLAGRTLRYVGSVKGADDPHLRRIRPSDVAELTALEEGANGYHKPAFCTAWFRDTQTRATLVLEGERGIEGVVTYRACREGFKIGPLVALDAHGARRLLHGAAARMAGAPLMIDVPGDCPQLGDYCDELGLTVPFETARMYRGAAPVSGPCIRAVATLELG